MSDHHPDAKAAFVRDLEQTAHAATNLMRDTVGLAHASAAGTWHLMQVVAEAAAQTSRQIAAERAKIDNPGADCRAQSGSTPSDGRVTGPDHGSHAPTSHATTQRTRPDMRSDTRSQADSELRSRGDQLLDLSADARASDDPHPAYQRILDDLAPDEARILRFLALDGPQPSVDIRSNRLLGIGSARIAGGLSMIGELSGCRHLDRTHAYFNNLHRLGLLWFSKEPVELHGYQLLEVQPAVVEATQRAGRSAKIIRRSIQLTPFGDDLCHRCFTLSVDE
jgi:hypothetical protein